MNTSTSVILGSSTIAWKDLRLYFRDRTSLLLGFLLPIALVVVFGFIAKFTFSGTGVPRVDLWIADDDDTSDSRAFVEAFRSVEMLRIHPEGTAPTLKGSQARKLVEIGEAHHALIIDAGFASEVVQGRFPKLTLVRDPDRTLEDKMVRLGFLQASSDYLSNRLPNWPADIEKLLQSWGFDDEQIKQFAASAAGENGHEEKSSDDQPGGAARPGNTFESLLQSLPVKNEDYRRPDRVRNFPFHDAQAVCGITVMMVMFNLMACSTTLLHERETGTLGRLMSIAVPRSSIFWGKFLFALVTGLVQLSIFFIFGNAIFRIEAFRDPFTLVILCLVWSAVATSFGMLIAVCSHTSRQAASLAAILILVMCGLGGCWLPIQMMNLPDWADTITKVAITRWAMLGYQGLFWDQYSWSEPRMLLALGVQIAFFIATSALALHFFKSRYLPALKK